MSNRLNQERERVLQPRRVKAARSALEDRGYIIIDESDTTIVFIHEGERISYFPYSGWASGRSIIDGRGLDHLLKQLNNKQSKT